MLLDLTLTHAQIESCWYKVHACTDLIKSPTSCKLKQTGLIFYLFKHSKLHRISLKMDELRFICVARPLFSYHNHITLSVFISQNIYDNQERFSVVVIQSKLRIMYKLSFSYHFYMQRQEITCCKADQGRI